MSDAAIAPSLEGTETVQDAAATQESAPEQQQQQDGAEKPQQEQKPELTEEQKRIRALERKLKKANQANGKMHNELEQFRSAIERQQPAEPEDQPRQQKQQEDPVEIARRLRDAERFNEQCDRIVEDGKAKHKGFDASIKALQEEAPLFENGEATPFLRTIMEAADKPEDVLNYLGANPDLAAEISDLSPARIAKRIALIEAELSAPRKPSAAPAPIKSERAVAAAKDPSPGEPGYIDWKLAKLNGR